MGNKLDDVIIARIRELYIEEGKKIKEIAEELSICEDSAIKYLRGIKKRTYRGREPGNKVKIEESDLKRIYEETNSSRKTGERFGVSKATILRELRERGITVRKEPIKGREPANKIKIPKKDLERVYNETKSADKTAQVFGVSRRAILDKLRQCHIPVNKPGGNKRPKSSHQKAKRYREGVVVNGKRIALHRYLMEKELGRELKVEETVHHIDMDKSNNTIENLYLFKDESEHMKAHSQIRQLISELFKIGVVGFNRGRYYIIKSTGNKERQR